MTEFNTLQQGQNESTAEYAARSRRLLLKLSGVVLDPDRLMAEKYVDGLRDENQISNIRSIMGWNKDNITFDLVCESSISGARNEAQQKKSEIAIPGVSGETRALMDFTRDLATQFASTINTGNRQLIENVGSSRRGYGGYGDSYPPNNRPQLLPPPSHRLYNGN